MLEAGHREVPIAAPGALKLVDALEKLDLRAFEMLETVRNQLKPSQERPCCLAVTLFALLLLVRVLLWCVCASLGVVLKSG